MFNTNKFGGYLSRLRKNSDMTQSELADKLSITRQAISSYERGDSFPDVSILVLIADIFNITLDDLINSGDPTRGEAVILGEIAAGCDNVSPQSFADIAGIAPLLRPSVIGRLSEGLAGQGVDISNLLALAEYLNDTAVGKLLENVTFDTINEELLEKLIPFLDEKSKSTVFQKILDGEMDWHFIRVLLPYAEYMTSQIEAAVIEGLIPWDALKLMKEEII
ncbi:MAG: helix-turn-helix transcriptional regulator [Eubacteriales bacterium]|nr:helix-turn-helix transcriptional regulator [Eubacteriales bacterium]